MNPHPDQDNEPNPHLLDAIKRDHLANMLRTLRKRDCNGYLTLDYTVEDIEDGSFKGDINHAITEVVVALSLLDSDHNYHN